MPIKVDIDFGSIDTKCEKAITKAQIWLDNEIIKDCTPYLPFREGYLLFSATTAINHGQIEYNVPYARRLYYGDKFNFNKSKHPLAGPYWFEKAKVANKETWVNGVQQIVKGEI